MTRQDWWRRGQVVAVVRRAGNPSVLAAAFALVLSLAWALWFARDGGDLAAQYAWAGFLRNHPNSAYNFSWYGGIHPASYSVISPYLMARIGVRTTGVLAGTVCAGLGGLLLTRSGIRKPVLPALALSVAIWCNVAAGRITFMLGMTFVLAAAVLLLTGQGRHRPVLAAAFGTIATLCSPVAGLFIEVLAAALFFTGRRRRGYLLAIGPAAVIAATTVLFPFGGVQPFPWYSALVTIAVAIAVAVLTPPTWRTVRAGAWVYALGAGLCWAIPTPIGSNVERLVLLASATVMFCAAIGRERRGWRTGVTYLVAVGLAVWTIQQPVAEFGKTAPVTAITAAAQPVITELINRGAEQGRVEIVPLRTHWEADGIASRIQLARGWNRQVDVKRNPLFYDGSLTANSYRAWLLDWAVRFVVLPAAELDSAGAAEARIVDAGPVWLPLVFQTGGWRVYQVLDATALASAPATVSYAGPAAVTVELSSAGSTLLRIVWSPWLSVTAIDGPTNSRPCLAQNGQWTELYAAAPGTFTIQAHYTRHQPCDSHP